MILRRFAGLLFRGYDIGIMALALVPGESKGSLKLALQGIPEPPHRL
jgi:hypothetical protein